MSKRNYYDEKVDKYQRKIQRLQEKQARKRRRIIVSSDSEENSDEAEDDNVLEGTMECETPQEEPGESTQGQELPLTNDAPVQDKITDAQKPDELPTLDPDVLLALGETTEETPKFGEKIHENLSRLWMPILRKGLNKDIKEKLLKQFLVPENCPLLQAPKLNPEISAAVSDASRTRDKRVESVQQQLGLGITALNRALTILLDNDAKKVEAIKLLSDSCRILCDLHYGESQARVKFVTPVLDKSFLNVIQDVDRDDMLFGNKLSEKIKASKVIEKQGLQIKRPAPAPAPKPSTSTSHPSASRPRQQGNWSGPPRYPQNKGGRGGARKTAPAGTSSRRGPPSSQTKSSHQNKNQRAPTQL